MRLRYEVAALLLGLAGCTTFPVIEANECGNAVLERDEDCDTFVDEDAGEVCRPPGAFLECHYDCTPGTDDTRGTCPSGMGCAKDGVCRRHRERFEEPELVSSDISSWVSSADFDGDGRAEVLSAELTDQVQQARFRVHYFDLDTELVETRTFPRVTTRPIARRMNDDSTDDLVFSDFRVGLLPGRKDHSFLPATFSSYILKGAEIRAVSVSDEIVEGALSVAAFTTVEGKTGVFVPSGDEDRLAIRHRLPRPISELQGEPLAANLMTAADSPCAELVFGYRGAASVEVLDLCEVATTPLETELLWRDVPPVHVVTLPRGVALDAQPLAADVNGDGHLDLLLGGGGRTYVARGDGAQLESEATLLSIPVQGQEQPWAIPMPLAAGDVTGDGAADFVLPQGLIGSRKSRVDGSTVYFQSFQNNAQPWTTAFVVDLNSNDRADVIAATEGAPGLSFLNGAAGPFLVGARISTRGPVRRLTTGEFDGDGVGDIAYVEGSSGGGSDLLALSYGVPDQLPMEPVRVAEVEGVAQLGRQRSVGADDVFTSSTDEISGERHGKFTLFAGDASRLPFAPYALVTFPEDGGLLDEGSPALMVGSFARPGQQDVLAMGAKNIGDAWHQWLLPSFAAGDDPPVLLEDGGVTPGVVPITTDAIGPRLSVAGLAVDLDGDGLDEALWLLPEGENGCVLLAYAVDVAAETVTPQSRLSLGSPCVAPELSSRDLNTDGHPDLLMLLGGRGVPGSLRLLWNDGGGGFRIEDSSVVAAPGDDDVVGFGLFPDEAVQLAFVTRSALFTATSREDSRQWVVTQAPGSFEDARSVVVTDPNGDGFADMVVADAQGLWLLEAELR